MSEKDLKKLYDDFHGTLGNEDFEIDIAQMEEFTLLGVCTAVEYATFKKHLGDKENEIYRHEFENHVILVTNGEELIIYGKHIKITDRGIEG